MMSTSAETAAPRAPSLKQTEIEAIEKEPADSAAVSASRHPPVVLGMSLGNPFFYRDENLEHLLSYAGTHGDQVKIFITDIIAEHNYRAIGCGNPERSARIKANRLRNKCKRAVKQLSDLTAKVSYVDWKRDVESSNAYNKHFEHIMHLFRSNRNHFGTDVIDVTDTALRCLLAGRAFNGKENQSKSNDGVTDNPRNSKETDKAIDLIVKLDREPSTAQALSIRGTGDDAQRDVIDVMEGTNYLLKELAFFMALPHLFPGYEDYVFVYHKPWPILENLIGGVYDGQVRTFIDFVILE